MVDPLSVCHSIRLYF
uniref:Uncharacterized protein n=1 Tax=Arundo donax TaxID=35708 RepID=A0A0A9AKP6_ARUDO